MSSYRTGLTARVRARASIGGLHWLRESPRIGTFPKHEVEQTRPHGQQRQAEHDDIRRHGELAQLVDIWGAVRYLVEAETAEPNPAEPFEGADCLVSHDPHSVAS